MNLWAYMLNFVKTPTTTENETSVEPQMQSLAAKAFARSRLEGQLEHGHQSPAE